MDGDTRWSLPGKSWSLKLAEFFTGKTTSYTAPSQVGVTFSIFPRPQVEVSIDHYCTCSCSVGIHNQAIRMYYSHRIHNIGLFLFAPRNLLRHSHYEIHQKCQNGMAYQVVILIEFNLRHASVRHKVERIE